MRERAKGSATAMVTEDAQKSSGIIENFGSTISRFKGFKGGFLIKKWASGFREFS